MRAFAKLVLGRAFNFVPAVRRTVGIRWASGMLIMLRIWKVTWKFPIRENFYLNDPVPSR